VDEKTLLNADETQDMLDSALLVPGTDIKIGLQNLNVTSQSADFAIIEGGVVTKFVHRDGDDFDIGVELDLLSGYKIYLTDWDTTNQDWITLAIGKSSEEFKITDGDTDVLGYAEAVIDDSTTLTGSECRLENEEMTISKDGEAQIENTNNWVQYTDDRELDVDAHKKKTTASGSTIKGTKSPWNDFLDSQAEVTVSNIGGTCTALSLSVKADTDLSASDKDGNIVLVGGPVSNVAVAELVTSGDSTVDWASSAGEIEVVQVGSNYRVIVAGGDRAATQAAADSLAGMLA
jgi:hypothetical protein